MYANDKFITLSVYFKLDFCASTSDSEGSAFKDNSVESNKHRLILVYSDKNIGQWLQFRAI